MRRTRKQKGARGIRELKTVTENRFIQKYGLYILLSLIAILVFTVFYDFIIFKKLYLFKGMAGDSLNDTYPNYILISDYLRTEGIPKWSFNQGLGQNIFPFSFTDPFVSSLYLLGRQNLAYGIAYMEIFKIFLAGILFYLFLKKRSLSSYVSITGGLLYCFSGFIIIGSCWNLFSTEAVYLALLLLAFEMMYQDGKWLLFPIVVTLIAILQPFDLWLFGLFLLVYILVRHFEENEKAYRKIFDLLLRTGMLALLGVGIASFFFLSEVRLMLNSPRVQGPAGFYDDLLSQSTLFFESGLHYLTALMRLFSSRLLGTSNQYGGWHNFMEAPLFYCGLINLLLVPQLFQFLDKRRKQIYALSLLVVTLPVIFPLFRYSLWLFTGDYYRVYSFFVAIVLMFFSMQALNYMCRNNKVNIKLLLITLTGLLILLYYPYDYFQQHDALNENLRNVVTLFLISYTVLLFFLRNANPAYAGLRFQMLLLLLVCIELVSFSKSVVNERKALTNVEYKQKTGYSDYTNDAIAYLNKIDSGFFRVSKNYSSGLSKDLSLNDAKVQRYKGTVSYHSFNHFHYVRFLAGMNIIDESNEGQTRWLVGLRFTPVLHSFASVRYYLSKGTEQPVPAGYDFLATKGDVNIFRNRYSLPLGFTYDKFISKRDFNLLSPRQKRVSVYKAFVLNDTIYRDYPKYFPAFDSRGITEVYPLQQYIDNCNRLRNDTLAISKFSNNKIIGNITLKERKMLFLSIPYSPGWSALVDGKKQTLLRINIGFLGLMLDKGKHNVELSFTPPLFYLGAVISALSILLYIILFILHKSRKEIQTMLPEKEN